jgi:hypothetical protein
MDLFVIVVVLVQVALELVQLVQQDFLDVV